MFKSFATCVSAEMFISFSCAMSMVAAPSGRSGATNFFELIGGFFSLWDVIYGSSNSGEDLILSRMRNRRKWNYLLCVKCICPYTERLMQLVPGNLVNFRQYNRVWDSMMIEPLLHHHVGVRWRHAAVDKHHRQL